MKCFHHKPPTISVHIPVGILEGEAGALTAAVDGTCRGSQQQCRVVNALLGCICGVCRLFHRRIKLERGGDEDEADQEKTGDGHGRNAK